MVGYPTGLTEKGPKVTETTHRYPRTPRTPRFRLWSRDFVSGLVLWWWFRRTNLKTKENHFWSEWQEWVGRSPFYLGMLLPEPWPSGRFGNKSNLREFIVSCLDWLELEDPIKRHDSRIGPFCNLSSESTTVYIHWLRVGVGVFPELPTLEPWWGRGWRGWRNQI